MTSLQQGRIAAEVPDPATYVWFTAQQVYAMGLLTEGVLRKQWVLQGKTPAWVRLVNVAHALFVRQRWAVGIQRDAYAQLVKSGALRCVLEPTRVEAEQPR